MTETVSNIKIATPPPQVPAEEMVEESEDCEVCCDDFNMSTKRKIKCSYCNYCASKS